MTSPGQNSTRGSQERRRATPEDFLFGKLIGEGSFSCVFLAKEIKTGREVAIKVSFFNFSFLKTLRLYGKSKWANLESQNLPFQHIYRL